MNLKVSSDAQFAKKEWPECFGTYRFFAKDEHGALIWRLLSSTHQRYLVRDHKYSVWKIFDRYDMIEDDYAFLSRYYTDVNFCPEYSQQGYWVYFNNTSGDYWSDDSIRIRCADNNSQIIPVKNSALGMHESTQHVQQNFVSYAQDPNEANIQI